MLSERPIFYKRHFNIQDINTMTAILGSRWINWDLEKAAEIMLNL